MSIRLIANENISWRIKSSFLNGTFFLQMKLIRAKIIRHFHLEIR